MVPDRGFGFDFSSCCEEHDKCYGCEGQMAHKSKQQCDYEFEQCMKKHCRGKTGREKWACENRGEDYAWGVRAGGDDFFDAARNPPPPKSPSTPSPMPISP
jgi:hypothetical protein